MKSAHACRWISWSISDRWCNTNIVYYEHLSWTASIRDRPQDVARQQVLNLKDRMVVKGRIMFNRKLYVEGWGEDSVSLQTINNYFKSSAFCKSVVCSCWSIEIVDWLLYKAIDNGGKLAYPQTKKLVYGHAITTCIKSGSMLQGYRQRMYYTMLTLWPI